MLSLSVGQVISADNSGVSSATGKPWKPGQSGNPNGRPSVIQEVRDFCREKSKELSITLADIANNEEHDPRDRIAAAKIIMEYGLGKPQQSIDLTGTVNLRPVNQLSDDEIRNELRLIAAELGVLDGQQIKREAQQQIEQRPKPQQALVASSRAKVKASGKAEAKEDETE